MENPKNIYNTLYEVRKIKDLKDLLQQSFELYGSQTAIMHKPNNSKEYQHITYNQLYKNVNELGTALWDLGLYGKKVIVIGENSYYWAITFFAVANGLGVIVPIDKELPKEELENLLKVSKASAIVYSKRVEEKILDIDNELLPDIDYYICMSNDKGNASFSINELLEKGKELLDNGDKRFINAEIDPEEMRFLFFTSATTDFAKGVMHSHKALCENLMAMSSMVFIGVKDTFLSMLPMHHTYECVCGFICPIYRGCRTAYCEGLRHIVKNMEEAQVTIILGVPLIFESIYKRIWKQAKKSGLDKKLKMGIKISNFLRKIGIDIRRRLFKDIYNQLGGHIRLFISGAAAIDPEVSKGIKDMGINCVQGYGLTECAPIIALNKDTCTRDGAAGMAMPGVEIRIDNPNDDGIGEIIANGPNIMLGYYENEELTKKVIKDGWYYTGDLGYIDKDGFVFITGRKKNMILTKNGKNVYPEELETYLNRSDYISESLVWGRHDEKRGVTFINAQILPDYEEIEQLLGENYTDEEINKIIKEEVKKVNSKMPVFKRITDYTLRDTEFIKTTTRKIKRYMERPEEKDNAK